jgi:hypothetical protein
VVTTVTAQHDYWEREQRFMMAVHDQPNGSLRVLWPYKVFVEKLRKNA